MPDESYTAWVNIFDNDLTKVYNQERKELKSAAMIYCALQREFERIKTQTEFELSDIRKGLLEKDQCLEKRNKHSLSLKENTPPLKNKSNESNSQDISTPDFFETNNSTIIDLSISDSEEIPINPTPSPTFKKKKVSKKLTLSPSLCFVSHQREDNFKSPTDNHRADNLQESTIIECTPEVKSRKIKTIKPSQFLSKKKLMKSLRPVESVTLTQFFSSASKSINKNGTNGNITKNNSNIKSTNQKGIASTSKEDIDFDSEITQIDESLIENNGISKSMEITDMLDYINRDSPITNLNQASANDSFFSMDDTHVDTENLDVVEECGTPAKKSRLSNESNNLRGWSCAECKNFYEYMELPAEELKKKMEDCSKHRGKNLDDTIPGFWDMSLRSQD